MDNNSRNILLVAIVLAILACCCLALVAGGLLVGVTGSRLAQDFGDFGDLGTSSARTTYAESLAVRTPVRLEADVQVGSVEIAVGEGNTVEVRAEVTAYGTTPERAQQALQRVNFAVAQSGDTVEITGDWDSSVNWGRRSPQIDVRVTVPRETAVQIDLGVGDVTLSGIAGNVDIEADVGQVTVRDVVVPEQLEIETDVAEINFQGSLNAGSEYRLTSDVGAIRLRLPSDSRFYVDATSNVGNVDVDFDVVGEESRDFVGKTVRGSVGGETDTRLILRSDVGSISVRPQ